MATSSGSQNYGKETDVKVPVFCDYTEDAAIISYVHISIEIVSLF